MSDARREFIDYMISCGVIPQNESDIQPGRFCYFDLADETRGKKSGRCLFHDDEFPNGVFWDMRINDKSEPQKWMPKTKREFTPEEKKAYQQKWRERQEQARLQKLDDHASAAESSQKIWDASTELPVDHPYLVRKQIKPYWFKKSRDGQIVIPIFKSGKIVSLQFIADDGSKKFKRGGEIEGCYSYIEKPGKKFYICEGFATAASIFEATKTPVVIAFNAGNLPKVALLMRTRLPDSEIIIAADNDAHKPERGNAGVKYATEAGQSINAVVRIPRFKTGKHTDFNDLAVHFGLDEVRRQLDGEKPEEITSILPFTFLGYRDGSHFVLHHSTQDIRAIGSSGLSETGIVQLAPVDIWASMFPSKTAAGFAKIKLIDWFIRKSEQTGRYIPELVRGRGAWTDQGKAVYHLGEKLWVNGDLCELFDLKSKYVYPINDPIPLPSDEPLTNAEGAKIIELASMFQWVRPASAKLVCGWVALAPICGALKWRPHAWVTGGPGSGKSTIQNSFVGHLLQGFAVNVQGNSTEAGIRQRLKLDALPVLFDEAESNTDREASRIQNILTLIRQSSSDSRSEILKGTSGGESQRYVIRSMFYLSSIQVGLKQQADMERVTVLDLKPKTEHKDSGADWDTINARLQWLQRQNEISTRLLRRALNLLPTTVKNIEIFSHAAAIKFGNQREGDQIGALMAGAWSLISDQVISIQKATEWIESEDWTQYRERSEGDESEKCLSALLQAVVIDGSQRRTIAEILMAVANPHVMDADEHWKTVLARHSMRYVDGRLQILNQSTAVPKLLSDTSFEVGWRDQLLRLPGAQREPGTVRIGGIVGKFISIPVTF